MSKTILNVEGMSCSSCVKHVNQALAIQGVTSVDVKLGDGSVVIDHESSVSVRQMITALEHAGYPAAQQTSASTAPRRGGCCGG